MVKYFIEKVTKNKKIELTLIREYDKKETPKIYYRNPEILKKPIEGKE